MMPTGFNDIEDDRNPYKDKILYPTDITHQHKSFRPWICHVNS